MALWDGKKVGVALGSGSARGCAHIGALRAVKEAGIDVEFVAGTSIGSLMGAAYSFGVMEPLAGVMAEFDWMQILGFFDLTLPRSGLIDGKKVSDFIRSYVRARDITDLPVPFAAVATELSSGKEVVMTEGDLVEALRASMSFPGIFTPVRKGDRLLVDGGLVNPVPISVVREMGAEFVIAVDLNSRLLEKGGRAAPAGRGHEDAGPGGGGAKGRPWGELLDALNERIGRLELPDMDRIRGWLKREKGPNIFEVLVSSVHIMERRITEANLRLHHPDVLIRPGLGDINFLEYNRAAEAIEAGYTEAKARLEEFS